MPSPHFAVANPVAPRQHRGMASEELLPDIPARAPSGPRPELVAYTSPGRAKVDITPAPRWRDWMNATVERWANRCLPLLIANEAGWTLLNPYGFEVRWDGNEDTTGITLEFDGGMPPPVNLVHSNFGYGVVTWSVPYLFRTPEGWNLQVRGPANWPKDGICALEGIVETDWNVATFTMNWKLTRPDHPVRFEAGEPFCMVVPQQRGMLESFAPSLRDIRGDEETFAASQQWGERRHQLQVRKFLGRFSTDFSDDKYAWERDYFKGLLPDGSHAEAHQTQLRLAGFDGSGAVDTSE